MKIAFGTDGWRARIDGESEFNETNVALVVQALADYWKQAGFGGTAPIVGYDRRRDSQAMSKVVAEVLAGNGFAPLVASQFCPTPTVSWMVKERRSIGGVVVTASHNPWQWNGIKFKESYGGSASPEYTQAVEKLLAANTDRAVRRGSTSQLSYFDPHAEYLGQLARLVDVERIRKSGIKVVYDPLYGAGTGFLNQLFPDQVEEIHGEADYHFGYLNPEPIESNLHGLIAAVKKGGYALGLATDGDADRIGAVDEHGRYVTSHYVFALLFKYLVEVKGLRGPIVKSVSTTKMMNALGKKYDLPVYETPVGFKHICKKFVEVQALLGGEESGGIGFGPHVYERDGVLNALFLMEMVAVYGKPLSELIGMLEADVGRFAYNRLDLHLEGEMEARARKGIHKPVPSDLAGKKVARIESIDGLKIHFTDEAWLLFRLSGTEPLVRIYAEAASDDDVARLIAAGKAFLLNGDNKTL